MSENGRYYDDLLLRFGAATALPLGEEVAAALLNKGITLGALGRSCDDLLTRFGTRASQAW